LFIVQRFFAANKGFWQNLLLDFEVYVLPKILQNLIQTILVVTVPRVNYSNAKNKK
jgi:hypothetical protein